MLKEIELVEEIEEVSNCPVCKATKFSPFLVCQDNTADTTQKFNLLRCDACNFVFTSPRPTATGIVKYYQSGNYISHSNEQKGIISKIYYYVRERALARKLAIINEFSTQNNQENNQNQQENQQKNLLDMGCGVGAFLEICAQNNWKIEGVETDSEARNLAQKTLSNQDNQQKNQQENITIFADVFEIKTEKKYDIITLWHVLEHIHELDKTIIHLKSLLKPNGRLIIAVPNLESADAQYFKQFWAAYDVPRHLYHFSKKTLTQLFERHNITLEKILPMKYDAFYISMLSMEYKDKSSFLNKIKAFWRGLVSNLKAGNDNYSSLIYVLKNSF